MKEDINNITFDEIEEFDQTQTDKIWHGTPSVDPNVLTAEEIMGKKSVEKETPAQYEDLSSSGKMSDAAQMIIEKMRKESEKKPSFTIVNMDDTAKVKEEELEKAKQEHIEIPQAEETQVFTPVRENAIEEIGTVFDQVRADKEKEEEAEPQPVDLFEEKEIVEEPQIEEEPEEFKIDIDIDATVPDAPIEEEVAVENTATVDIDVSDLESDTIHVASTNIFKAPKIAEEEEEFIDEEEEYDDPREIIDDRDEIRSSLLSQRRGLRAQGIVTFIVTALLFGISLIKPWEMTDALYYYVSFGLMAVALAVNFKIVASLSTLFRRVPNSDCAPALSMVFSVIQLLVCFIFKDNLQGHNLYLSMFASASCVSALFATLGKLSITKRVLANLEMLDENEIHNAAVFIAPPYSAQLADVQEIGETLICARRKAKDLKGFLHYSLALDPYEVSYQKILIISVVIAWIAGLVYGLLSGRVISGVTMATAVFTLFAPFSTLVVNGICISGVCKRLRARGAVLSGYAAAEEIGNANVIEFEAGELFDSDSVRLYNFKTFEDYPFPQAVADACAITRAVDSPLAGMFTKILSTYEITLPEVDCAEYEEKMGVTGWINEKKTIIGNRMIMESHNVAVPALDFDKKIIQSGKFPVYLATDGKLTAVFVVGYKIKKQMVIRIRKLANTGVTILVRTTDPNVSNDLICKKFGISEDSVIIMTSSASHYYSEITAESESEPAMLVARNAKGFIDAYIQSINAKQTASIASCILFIGSIVMTLLSVVLCFMGSSGVVNAITVPVIHLLGLGIVSFINMIRS